MSERLIDRMLIVLVVGLMLSPAYADLVGYWKFDESGGDIAIDKSGNGNDGTLVGGPERIAGNIGSSALSFDGADDLVEIAHDSVFDLGESVTIAAWINLRNIATYYFIAVKGPSGTARDNYPGNFEFRTDPSGTFQFGHQTGEGEQFIFYTSGATVPAGQWVHVAGTLVEGGSVEFYSDGQSAGSATQSGEFGILNDEPVRIGGRKDSFSFFNGAIDDVQIYDHVLTAEEIQAAMEGLSSELAAVVGPKDGAVDVFRDVVLEWAPGDFAKTHAVYFSTNFDDAVEATLDDPRGALIGQDLTDTTFNSGRLEFDQTYLLACR